MIFGGSKETDVRDLDPRSSDGGYTSYGSGGIARVTSDRGVDVLEASVVGVHLTYCTTVHPSHQRDATQKTWRR